ncbi:MAG: antitoxin YefM [Bacteroidota bacterium]|nr:antitoxin YefM [Bacteroidota bacterium]
MEENVTEFIHKKGVMKNIKLNSDIRPLSELRTKAIAFINHISTTKRPIVITKHGKCVAVLVDVQEYENLIDRAEAHDSIKVIPSNIDYKNDSLRLQKQPV